MGMLGDTARPRWNRTGRVMTGGDMKKVRFILIAFVVCFVLYWGGSILDGSKSLALTELLMESDHAVIVHGQVGVYQHHLRRWTDVKRL